MAGTDYVIDWERTTSADSGGGVLRVWRSLTSSDASAAAGGGDQCEMALACCARRYVIIGISTGSREGECLDAVRHMAKHVETAGFQDDPNADVYGQIGGSQSNGSHVTSGLSNQGGLSKI